MYDILQFKKEECYKRFGKEVSKRLEETKLIAKQLVVVAVKKTRWKRGQGEVRSAACVAKG